MARYCKVDFTDTLMRYSADDDFYVESGDRASVFYFQIPDDWAALEDFYLQEKIRDVAEKMYADLGERFRAAQPEDTSYMLVKHTQATLLDARAAGAKPWEQAEDPAIWEPTPCVISKDDGSYEKVPREEL